MRDSNQLYKAVEKLCKPLKEKGNVGYGFNINQYHRKPVHTDSPEYTIRIIFWAKANRKPAFTSTVEETDEKDAINKIKVIIDDYVESI